MLLLILFIDLEEKNILQVKRNAFQKLVKKINIYGSSVYIKHDNNPLYINRLINNQYCALNKCILKISENPKFLKS